jgi:hypothetical protein
MYDDRLSGLPIRWTGKLINGFQLQTWLTTTNKATCVHCCCVDQLDRHVNCSEYCHILRLESYNLKEVNSSENDRHPSLFICTGNFDDCSLGPSIEATAD